MPVLGDEKRPGEATTRDAAVVVQDLYKDFPAARRPRRESRTEGAPTRGKAVNGITLQARRGEITAVLGANGAGKSTTLSCAQGLMRPTSGFVRLLGTDPWGAGPELRARVGIMLQDGGLPQAIRPIPLLKHVASMYETPADLEALIERLGINGFDGTPVRRLSGGQKQRVAMAAALVGGPEVLFLDEPSAGLDPQSRKVVFDLIRELRDEGTCIVLTTHLMDDAQRLADYVYIVDAGQNVVEGRVHELLSPEYSGQRARFTVSQSGLSLTNLFPESLSQGLELRETQHGTYELSGPIRPEHLVYLTKSWERSGELPLNFELTSKSLEDLFLEVSGSDVR